MANRLNVELDDDRYGYLRRRADREGRSMVSIIREAIDRLRASGTADAEGDPMYAVGSFEGPCDLAERHDEYLYG